MSSGEILLILLVALIVFGPNKLPMLARHLGLLIRRLNQFKAQATVLWQQQLNELQLQENQRKAKEADEQYKKEQQSS
ncbi:twin-arginine translocase TatA/TatE family subunit [Fluoribacter dumoffii]|uniref:Twin arginine translocase protein A n=1 Tax=Fluoribacter dumoffii TaxID=463 RepID=A0A377G6R9_9GAMM|nr:twin-arginine translocase TatA/TatE family subunit [Fluoribacter dumoffii]KTC91572.1 TatB protein (twin arginine translocation) [Fluoribacter dumoffii NY 23]MCW8387304.1 twin-arginine translocase TatA/TatE family subunit [Fluoribacter dumoffii]MCW8417190.1 twin-arginine translocase TatA/TatE family subunit [Fluoribacter dumoffii]MCW8454970.1 twin-arginine translocase TatA/TatE family subunit [Fluoribacter dumoffii]MCW8460953.1 twin-arginine translocase TatA/TatE family subunit [Fluoribacter